MTHHRAGREGDSRAPLFAFGKHAPPTVPFIGRFAFCVGAGGSGGNGYFWPEEAGACPEMARVLSFPERERTSGMIWKLICAAVGLGFAAVGVVESGLGERLSLALSQPEGCPEGGCRVGYRFEDGGIRPEGWEPYETDDPVVALMDACMTHLMTGTLTEHSALRVEEDQSSIFFRIDPTALEDRYLDHNNQVRIRNQGFDPSFSTFECRGYLAHDKRSWSEIVDWVSWRITGSPEWKGHLSGHQSFEDGLFLVVGNEELDLLLRVASRTRGDGSENNGSPMIHRQFLFLLVVRYRGPADLTEMPAVADEWVY